MENLTGGTPPVRYLPCVVPCKLYFNGLITATEAEYDRLQAVCDALPTEEDHWAMRSRNWERVFDLSPLDDEWCTRGNCIQATFWELRKEQVKRVTHFVSAVDPKRFDH